MDFPKIEYSPIKKEEELDSLNNHRASSNSQTKRVYRQEGQWTNEENLKVILFLEYFKDIFSYRNRRRFCHIFTWLSKVMKDRTARQCRCRHQKMMSRFKNFNGAKKHLIGVFGKEIFEAKFIQNMEEFEQIAAEMVQEGPPLNIVKKNERLKKEIMSKMSQNKVKVKVQE